MRLVSPLVLVFAFISCGQPSHKSELSSRSESRQRAYPLKPETSVTPGTTCQKPDTYRYPERIKYCERDVKSSLKYDIMRDYDARFGYQVTKMERMQFKIDHFIPLCMGGSNERDNLWPQHKTVYEVTDPLEEQLCKMMAAGKMLQAEAIQTIKRAKFNLSEAATIRRELSSGF